MSATVDSAKFAAYFQKLVLGQFQPAPVISINRNTNFVVQTHYLNELSTLGEVNIIKMVNLIKSDLIEGMTCQSLCQVSLVRLSTYDKDVARM